MGVILDGSIAKKVDLVSVATNWAEMKILAGMQQTIANRVIFISLIYGKTSIDYYDLLHKLGYYFYSQVDRGIRFKKKVRT